MLSTLTLSIVGRAKGFPSWGDLQDQAPKASRTTQESRGSEPQRLAARASIACHDRPSYPLPRPSSQDVQLTDTIARSAVRALDVLAPSSYCAAPTQAPHPTGPRWKSTGAAELGLTVYSYNDVYRRTVRSKAQKGDPHLTRPDASQCYGSREDVVARTVQLSPRGQACALGLGGSPTHSHLTVTAIQRSSASLSSTEPTTSSPPHLIHAHQADPSPWHPSPSRLPARPPRLPRRPPSPSVHARTRARPRRPSRRTSSSAPSTETGSRRRILVLASAMLAASSERSGRT